MGKVSPAAMDLKTSSFAHNINLYTTDGRVQSPAPAEPESIIPY